MLTHRPAFHIPLARLFLAASALLVLITGCQFSQSVPENDERAIHNTTFSFDQGVYPNELDLFPKYHVTPGDILDVIFQINRSIDEDFHITLYHTITVKFVELPNLDTVQEVLPNGTITLPYLGSIDVLGKRPAQLQKELVERYSERLRDPQIVVNVLNFNTRIEQLRQDLHTAPRGLSKLVTVRPDGYASFPLIGEHLVARQTLDQVNIDIQEKYTQFMPGMKVDLFLHEQGGAVVYVTGEVARPGAYEMRKPIAVIQAITLAGGSTNEAEMRNVIVFRQYEKKRLARSINLQDLTTVREDVSFFILRPDDIIYVPRRRISTLAQLMREIGDITFFRGWSVGYGLGEEVDFVSDRGVTGDNN